MHIPDGYLSPTTSIVLITVCTPFIIRASRETSKKLNSKTIPRVSLFASLSFVIMMLNIPLPGGTTGHAVGAVIASIILGPWMAMLSVAVALVIQAFFFGDGGILSLGANIFNMAVLMPIVGSAVYNYLDRWSYNKIRRKIIFSGIAGYIAINFAAFFTGLELGIQPILFHNNQGQSLYFPFGLGISIPAMMIGHLTIGGMAEAIVTGLTLSWFVKTNPGMVLYQKKEFLKKDKKVFKWDIILLLLLILSIPLGLLAPGTAWGEWSREELGNLGLGYIPEGFDKWANIWKSPFPDYSIPPLRNPTVGYVFSGIFGIILSYLFIRVIFLVYKQISALLRNRNNIKNK